MLVLGASHFVRAASPGALRRSPGVGFRPNGSEDVGAGHAAGPGHPASPHRPDGLRTRSRTPQKRLGGREGSRAIWGCERRTERVGVSWASARQRCYCSPSLAERGFRPPGFHQRGIFDCKHEGAMQRSLFRGTGVVAAPPGAPLHPVAPSGCCGSPRAVTVLFW